MEQTAHRPAIARNILAPLHALASGVAIGLIRLYQHTVGAILPDSCRFEPTCSEYCIRAVRKFGALKGAWLGVRRILRCHPYCDGGRDPLP